MSNQLERSNIDILLISICEKLEPERKKFNKKKKAADTIVDSFRRSFKLIDNTFLVESREN